MYFVFCVQLLLMEHKVPNGDDGGAVEEQQILNLPEKSEYSKMPAELAAYYRDLSSASTCSFLLFIIIYPPSFLSTLFLLT